MEDRFYPDEMFEVAERREKSNREYNEIAISDIEDLIEALDEQATAFLKRVREFKDSAEGVA
jgi:hypothetical protein